jgi:hypothetical protein
MIYEPERTRSIINRLVVLGNNLRIVLMIMMGIEFGALLGIFGGLVLPDIWLLLMLFGVVVGATMGYFFANALTLLLEWAAQLLISLQPTGETDRTNRA